MNVMDLWKSVAEEAYKAYAKNFGGEKLSKFNELSEKIQDAWVAAVSRSVDYCVEKHLNGLDWAEEYRDRA